MRLGTLLFRRRLSREPLRPRLSCRGLAFEALEDRRLMSVSADANLLSGMAATLATAADVAPAQPFTALPQVTNVLPVTGSTAGGTSVTLTGSGFIGATAVTFGTVAATSFTVVSDHEITAISPAQTPRIIDVLVTTPSGTSGNDSSDQFVYAPPITGPQVGSISPPAGSTLGGTSVAITGINFTGATAVTFGTVPATSFNVISDTQMTATSPAQAAGSVDVTVTGPNGTSATSLADLFVYEDPPAPTVTAVSPARGSTAGGTPVTITGTGFDGATAVTFGGTPATSFSVLSDSQITAISPPGTAGANNVTVATVNGTSATGVADQFAYTAVSSASTIGLYTPTPLTFYLRNSNTTGFATTTFTYGPANKNLIAIVGDWSGDGVDTVGWYNPTTSVFSLANSNVAGATSTTFVFGPANSGMVPVAGNWGQSNGVDTIGLYNPTTSMFFLRNSNTTGFADTAFVYGPANDGMVPIVGNWGQSNGVDTVGLYNPTTSMFFLKNSNNAGFADTAFVYGPAHSKMVPIAGDWTGAGTDTIALYNPTTSMFLLKNSNSTGFADTAFNYGPANQSPAWIPLAGNWTASAEAEMAAVQVPGASNVPALSQSALAPIVKEAITLWSQAGLSTAEVQKLRQAQFVISDLPGSYLGETEGDVIHLDTNAAGNGWFIDPTPASNEEFSARAGGSQLRAVDAQALDRIDLLTVVEHELGHIAGLSDSDALPDDIMDGVLDVGVRRIASHADTLLASV